MLKYLPFLIILLCLPKALNAQEDSLSSTLSFEGDFRFRLEQDWDSKKSDGSFRDDRSRLRYRGRFGVTYKHKSNITVGARIRTGNPKKQQDPQLTLGDNFKEFGTLPIALEKLYVQYHEKWFSVWAGKNTFPYKKQNELFWSDNVFPEGLSFSSSFKFKTKFINSLDINAGHFIIEATGKSFDSDRYFQGIQFVTSHFNNSFQLFPALYYFNDIPNVPDGNGSFEIDYAILHLGSKINLSKKVKLALELDYYKNIKDLSKNDSIPSMLRDQKHGFISALSIGQLKRKKDWKIKLTYTYLERFAAVDYFAQNDWARWDYSSQDSPDGRLTNFKGYEVMGGYAIDKNINIKVRYFSVDQIRPLGLTKETGDRIRFDINISF